MSVFSRPPPSQHFFPSCRQIPAAPINRGPGFARTLRRGTPGFAFGYVYLPGHGNEYTIHDVSYMPAAPVTLTGEIGTHPVKSAVAGVTTPEYTMQGEHWMEYWFDEGDPLGDYRIDVVVDGRCVRSIRFTVVEDAGAPTTGGTVRR